jgi:uncharacterized damage-inducible protein DinB
MIKEIEGYLSILEDLRGQVKKGLEGLAQEGLDWRPLPEKGDGSTNALGAIATHLAGSETYWMKEIIGGQPIDRDRETEFAAKGAGVLELKEMLDKAAQATKWVLSSLSPSQLDEERKFRDRKVSVRWAILHVIEHTATHLGHIQLTRQLWENQGKRTSP